MRAGVGTDLGETVIPRVRIPAPWTTRRLAGEVRVRDDAGALGSRVTLGSCGADLPERARKDHPGIDAKLAVARRQLTKASVLTRRKASTSLRAAGRIERTAVRPSE